MLALGLAVTVLYPDAAALVPALRSYWLIIHVSVMVLSFAIFTVGAVLAALYLWRLRDEQRGSLGAVTRRLPDAGALDRVTYRVHAFAFPLFTFAVIAVAIGLRAPGGFTGEGSQGTWRNHLDYYAAYLHLARPRFERSPSAVIALVGYAAFCSILSSSPSFSGLPPPAASEHRVVNLRHNDRVMPTGKCRRGARIAQLGAVGRCAAERAG